MYDWKPYKQMGKILTSQDRDIVFNLCQYGMGEVWKWGGEVDAHCWRTGGDLGFELDRIFDVALKNAQIGQYNKAGEWNDPDYIQIGWIGNAGKMGIFSIYGTSAVSWEKFPYMLYQPQKGNFYQFLHSHYQLPDYYLYN